MVKSLKKVLSILLSVSLIITTLLVFSSTSFAATYSGYILGYFKDGATQYGLNLCCSTDGLHWTDLNNGNPVYVPTLGQKGLRDPFVFRKQDGTFGVVATDMRGQTWSDHSQYIQYFDSTDLCTFSNARLLQVHYTTMHAWAPEVFYDAANSRYGIYWSGNTDYNRTYVNYTTDFQTVTSNQVFFDPGYDVIDSDIIANGSTNYLLFKDERSTGKQIKAAKSTSFNPGSFSVFTPNFLTSANTEGPITFKDNNTATWYMYADLFAQGGVFECWKTTDLNATSWTKVTDISLPAGVRHGSIVPVTQAELDNIKAKWGITQYYKIRNRATNMNIDGYGRTANGSDCSQYGESTSYNQQWTIEAYGSYYLIRNRTTGLLLDGMGRTSNGSICGQYSTSYSNNQQWAREAAGSYYKFKNRATGLYLDGMGSTTYGAALCQYSSSSSYNQQWSLVQQ